MQWSEYECDRLTDLVFDSSYSTQEIARELDRTELEVVKQIRELGLGWVKKKKRNGVSRGQTALTDIMRKLIPGQKIENEYVIGERLRLDVYCPAYKLAAEYHGRQHFYYVPHFHGTKDGFYESQARDERKIELCREQGIELVTFRFNDSLTEDAVYDRLLFALRNSKALPAKDLTDNRVPKYRGNPFYEEQKEKRRQYRKEQYKRSKARRRRG